MMPMSSHQQAFRHERFWSDRAVPRRGTQHPPTRHNTSHRTYTHPTLHLRQPRFRRCTCLVRLSCAGTAVVGPPLWWDRRVASR